MIDRNNTGQSTGCKCTVKAQGVQVRLSKKTRRVNFYLNYLDKK